MGSHPDASPLPGVDADGPPPQRSITTDPLWLGAAAAGLCCCWLLLHRRRVSNVLLQYINSCGRFRCPVWGSYHRTLQRGPAPWKVSRAAEEASSDEGSETDDEAGAEDALAAAALDYKMVLCVRQDLGMSKGKIAAQCSHATLGAYLRAKRRCHPDCLNMWTASGQKKIAVRVQDEAELEELEWEAHKKGVNAYAVHDAGRTQVPTGTVTVLAVGPVGIAYVVAALALTNSPPIVVDSKDL